MGKVEKIGKEHRFVGGRIIELNGAKSRFKEKGNIEISRISRVTTEVRTERQNVRFIGKANFLNGAHFLTSKFEFFVSVPRELFF